jgi:hypothetical protein
MIFKIFYFVLLIPRTQYGYIVLVLAHSSVALVMFSYSPTIYRPQTMPCKLCIISDMQAVVFRKRPKTPVLAEWTSCGVTSRWYLYLSQSSVAALLHVLGLVSQHFAH